ncbi:YebC/PmpR family DNA-binding transcriptional regulator [Candidatus Berkelbacteria bacterium]|nr:YebC/PmpR family DNA-binding transcriptional regulator [Candidatus Berkelbacteria bacterium]
MAGHSKWAQIKRQKGAADIKRGATFSKLSNAITLAARNGTDPDMNFQLRIAIDRAKAANMPKDNIDRAIDRVKNSANALEEILFEAYGPAGTAYLIECATDNRNRTIGEIRATLNKLGGKLAESGSVGYLFKQVGQITIDTENPEEIELEAIDEGATDVDVSGNTVFVYTEAKELEQVRKQLLEKNIPLGEVTLEWISLSSIPITEKSTAQKVIKLTDALDELDDVTKVHPNFEINQDLLS